MSLDSSKTLIYSLFDDKESTFSDLTSRTSCPSREIDLGSPCSASCYRESGTKSNSTFESEAASVSINLSTATFGLIFSVIGSCIAADAIFGAAVAYSSGYESLAYPKAPDEAAISEFISNTPAVFVSTEFATFLLVSSVGSEFATFLLVSSVSVKSAFKAAFSFRVLTSGSNVDSTSSFPSCPEILYFAPTLSAESFLFWPHSKKK